MDFGNIEPDLSYENDEGICIDSDLFDNDLDDVDYIDDDDYEDDSNEEMKERYGY